MEVDSEDDLELLMKAKNELTELYYNMIIANILILILIILVLLKI